jgi:hypothetical protein
MVLYTFHIEINRAQGVLDMLLLLLLKLLMLLKLLFQLGLLLELGHNISLAEYVELSTLHLQLSTSKLWQKNLISDLDSHGKVGSSLVPHARAHGHDSGMQGLVLRLLREKDASLSLGFSGNTLNKNSVEQRHDLLGDGDSSAGHCG